MSSIPLKNHLSIDVSIGFNDCGVSDRLSRAWLATHDRNTVIEMDTDGDS